MRKYLMSAILAAGLTNVLWAQYYGDRPLEMSFEKTEFFFRPIYLNPLSTENFEGPSLVGLHNPLIDLQRNPANLSRFDKDSLPGSYFYVGFRNSRSILNNHYGGIYPYDKLSVSSIAPRYGYYYTSERKELTPLMSIAWLSRLPVFNKSVTLGVTYQVITLGEKYYSIPYDIYRNAAGKNLDGASYAGLENYTITDRFSGSDEMYHEGHSIQIFSAYEINEQLTLGIKAGKFLFDRDGSLGSNNIWDQQPGYQNYWKTNESRNQQYDHLDFSLGATYKQNNSTYGAYAGFLSGKVSQLMTRKDDSYSQYGSKGTNNWSLYKGWYTSDQDWNHEGNTYYSSLQMEHELNNSTRFRLMYDYSYSDLDLRLKSSIENQSENEYYYKWNTNSSQSNGSTKMYDFRNGSGGISSGTHIIRAALSWQVTARQTFVLGAIAGLRSEQTKTSERTDSYSEVNNYYKYINNSNETISEYYRLADEDKTINWEYSTRMRTFQMPVFYQLAFKERYKILLGINRSMNFWRADNTTLILYDYRRRINNSEVLVERMTGERITEPRERMSVIKTSFLGNFCFSPARNVGVNFSISPEVSKSSYYDSIKVGMQFWVGISLQL